MFTLDELEKQKQCVHNYTISIINNFNIDYYAIYMCKKCGFGYKEDITDKNYNKIFGSVEK
jgi:hypothetical protein